MSAEYLDKNGLTYFWGKLKAWVKRNLVSNVSYDAQNHTINMTKYDGTNDAIHTTPVVSASTIVVDGGGITSHQDISGKADKVQNAVSGNLAGLDSTGNLTDSGKSVSDFATAAQGELADTAYQKPSTGIPASDLADGVIPQPEVFFATYGTTTASEVEAALQDGKIVIVNETGAYYFYASKDINYYYFSRISGDVLTTVRLKISDSTYSKNPNGSALQFTNRLVTSLSSSSTNAQYPSAKCVYDALVANDNVFVAEYGVTTYQELVDAFDENKVIVLFRDNGLISWGIYKTGDRFSFVSTNGGPTFFFSSVNSNDVWSQVVASLENISNKVSTITGNEASTTKYPNTKAVADALADYTPTSQLATVATSGDYDDLINKPVIPDGIELLVLDEDSGTLTQDQILLVQSNHCIIVFDDEYYFKNYEEGTNIDYVCNYIYDAEAGIKQNTISINTYDGSYFVNPNNLNIQSDWNEMDSTSVAYIRNKPTIPDISGKADKVQNATNGNFAGLDSNGNLTDSGYDYSDFLSSSTVLTTITFRQW